MSDTAVNTWRRSAVPQLQEICADLARTWGTVPSLNLRAFLWWHILSAECAERWSRLSPSASAAAWRRLRRDTHAAMQRSLAATGEPCGAIATQSIGEPSTQLTLNTFHYAGTGHAAVTDGVKRLLELIEARVLIATPVVKVALLPWAQENAARIAARVPCLSLQHVVKNAEVLHEPAAWGAGSAAKSEDAALLHDVAALFGYERNLQDPARPWSPYVIRLVLRRKELLRRRRRPAFVARAMKRVLGKVYDAAVLYSTPAHENWVVRVRLLRDHTYDGAHLVLRAAMQTLRLEGMPSVRHAEVVTPSHFDGRMPAPAPLIHSHGTGFSAWASVPEVDWLRTVSTHVAEVQATLGIVAAEAVLMHELANVLNDDMLDPRHLQHLVLAMTHDGGVKPMNRQGLNNAVDDVLRQACFEQTEQVLVNAALNHQEDRCSSITGCVAVGNRVPVGSGTVGVEYDAAQPQHAARAEEVRLAADLRPPRRGDALLEARHVSQLLGPSVSDKRGGAVSLDRDEDAAVPRSFRDSREAVELLGGADMGPVITTNAEGTILRDDARD